MKHNGKITMGRPTLGDGKECVRLQIWDNASKQHFVEVELTLDNFTRALTGQARIECTFEHRGLAHVGCERVVEPRTVELNSTVGMSRKDLEEWLRENCQEAGWYVDPYLGSQSSMTRNDGKTQLHYRVFRYVEPGDE